MSADAHREGPKAAGRFREITEAYDVLGGGPQRRASYDRQLLAWMEVTVEAGCDT